MGVARQVPCDSTTELVEQLLNAAPDAIVILGADKRVRPRM